MKTAQKKRKTYDMSKKRLQGTDAEGFNKKPLRGGRVSIKSAWKANLATLHLI